MRERGASRQRASVGLLTYTLPLPQVPATDWEALKSPLMGLFEKRRAAKFFSYCQQYDERNPQVLLLLPSGCWAARPSPPACLPAFSPHPLATRVVPHASRRPGVTGTCPA